MFKAKHPQVSIIIPNYNHAKYLPQRLESVYDQTYQDFEVILLVPQEKSCCSSNRAR